MNFAGRNLKLSNDTPGDLTPREKRLLAENQKLKRKNKRLSSAMLFLVDTIEAKLPFLNGNSNTKPAPVPTKAQTPVVAEVAASPRKTPLADRVERRHDVRTPPKAAPKRVAPSAPAKAVEKPKVVGTAWTPEKLEPSTTRTPTRPLSMQQIFAEKKRDREEKMDDGVSIPEVPKEATPPAPVEPEIPITAVEVIAEPIPEVPTIAQHTPDLAPEEIDLLAAPTRDKKVEGALASDKIIAARKEEKKTAAEASLAYMAVSTVSRPLPSDVEVLKDDVIEPVDIIDPERPASLAARAAQHNVMREAMLRRVNRLRW